MTSRMVVRMRASKLATMLGALAYGTGLLIFSGVFLAEDALARDSRVTLLLAAFGLMTAGLGALYAAAVLQGRRWRRSEFVGLAPVGFCLTRLGTETYQVVPSWFSTLIFLASVVLFGIPAFYFLLWLFGMARDDDWGGGIRGG